MALAKKRHTVPCTTPTEEKRGSGTDVMCDVMCDCGQDDGHETVSEQDAQRTAQTQAQGPLSQTNTGAHEKINMRTPC